MKKILIANIFLLCSLCLMSQVSQSTLDKRAKRKNLTVKEWNESAGTKTRYLDHLTKYNDLGQKIEEIEYANYGMKMRTTYEYSQLGTCIKEVEYDGRNKPVRIRKFEYYPDGSKKKQYNYFPNGKLEATKEFEYIFDK